jgi:hypothetical protein
MNDDQNIETREKNCWLSVWVVVVLGVVMIDV